MKTIVINTSKEAKDTKLDILFKAPFDQNSLLWIDSELELLGENAQKLQHSLIEQTDTVDRDYQLIVLVDLYPFPYGNDKSTVPQYRALLERYVLTVLVEQLHGQLNLSPNGVSVYFVDSAKTERGLDIDALAENAKVQQEQQRKQEKQAMTQERDLLKRVDGDLNDEYYPLRSEPEKPELTQQQRRLMDIFGWTEAVTKDSFSWTMKTSVSGDTCIDFSEIFKDTARAIRASHESADILSLALREVMESLEKATLTCVGRVPFHSLTCFVSRENEQSKLEGFFCLFANVFSCVQEKALLEQVKSFDKEQIRELLVAALKKYRYFSAEENITVRFEPITKVFEQRKAICERRKKEARGKSEFKDKSDEEVAEQVMSECRKPQTEALNGKLHGLDRAFHELAEEIFGNYDAEVIHRQNNRIVKSCLEGLWNWRDKQTDEGFRCIVNDVIAMNGSTAAAEAQQSKRDSIAFIEEEYEAARAELINQVTDAENKLAGNKNILLETKDLVLKYSDWMRKGMWSWISFIGAVFTVLATVFPFFYTEYCSGVTGVGFQVNLLSIVGLCAVLYAVAAGIYIGYINRKKLELILQLQTLRDQSEEDRKASIIALYRYYNDTVVEAESHCLLWREILRRDQENAKKGIKRNYHIKRLKNLAEQVERFITMLKLDVPGQVTAGPQDWDSYVRQGLGINGEESYYQQENRRVYCLLPEKDTLPQKGDEEEA